MADINMEVHYNTLVESLNGFVDDFDAFAKRLKGETGARIVEKACEIYLKEQKRILAKNFPDTKLLGLLRLWVNRTKYGWCAHVGYDELTIETYPETLVVEFGRPICMEYGLNTETRDAIGRKIGYVPAYSHIRAAIFLKKEEVHEEIRKLFAEETKKVIKQRS